ncbi:hypothetical protein [Cohnella nanjingensis]|uniref:Uncharacterized protein n=1 Tax=Cohnella nanjingensis TaxID=1387779 RepID=A0A7X0VEQ5_9BACL|nr:hypothetical protein [Cohnella nanjingensis]MBB6671260.1 hypothetical protein [Cohnella nanjingensis]
MDNKYLIADEVIIDARPTAVPYNYRISYKLAQLCLIIELCCRGGCSILKLHMISVGLSTIDDMKRLKEFVFNNSSNYTVVRFDPAVNHGVKYAIAEGLMFQQQNGLFRLTKKGKAYVRGIMKDKDILIDEKRYLFDLGEKLTDEKIKALTSFWRYSDVEDK